jgi:hypothetical protein
MKTFSLKSLSPFALVGVLVLVALFALACSNQSTSMPSQPNQGTVMIVDFNINPNSKRALIGSSSHVFVGRIIAQEGDLADSEGRPKVAYSAEVLERIKGELPDQVRLAYITHAQGNVITFDGDPKLLLVNQPYLFIANYKPESDIYELFQGEYGTVEIIDDSHEAGLIAIYSDAYANELRSSDPNYYDEMAKDANSKIDAYPAIYNHLYPAPDQDADVYPDPKQ